MRAEPGTVSVGQGEGQRPDAPEPAPGSAVALSRQLDGTFPLKEVDDHPAVEVHEGGGVHRRVCGVRRKVGVLVDTERTHRAHPARVVHERGPAIGHRRPRGVPADPVLGGHRGDRRAERVHLAGHLVAGPSSEHLARDDAVDRLGPRQVRTAWAPAPSAALVDEQMGRAPEAVHVAQVEVDALLGLGALAARRAPDPALRGLAGDDDVAGLLFHLEHDDARDPQLPLRMPSTVAHVRGILRWVNGVTATMSGPLAALVDGQPECRIRETPPRSSRKSPFRTICVGSEGKVAQ